jgi:UDP-glucuronate decarboxylase
VDDLVDGLIRLMNSPPEVTGPINLGNPSEFTMLELAELVIELTGTDSSIEFRELPVDDPMRRRPDITRAKEDLEWEPNVALREGLSQTINYFDDLLSDD